MHSARNRSWTLEAIGFVSSFRLPLPLRRCRFAVFGATTATFRLEAADEFQPTVHAAAVRSIPGACHHMAYRLRHEPRGGDHELVADLADQGARVSHAQMLSISGP